MYPTFTAKTRVAHMAFYVCWLLADESDAEAIRTAYVADRPLTAWPYLSTRAVDAMDVNKLERVLLPKKKGVRTPAAGGKLLASGKRTVFPFTCVSRVEPAFVRSLAALGDADLDTAAANWVQRLEDAEPAAVRELLCQLSAFARRAEEA